MRIAIDGRYIQDQYHGVGRYIYEVAAQLAVLYPQQEWLIFYHANYANTRFDLKGLGTQANVTLLPVSLRLFWPQQQFLWPKLLRQHRVDLFHTPFFDAPWFAPCPVVVTIHDLIFDRYPQFMPQRHLRPVYHLLTSLSVRKAAQILTVSEATKRDLSALYALEPNKISVTPEAAAANFHPVSQKEAERVRQHYRLPSRFVLTVGTMRPQKNIPTLIRAFAQLASHTDACLVLAGRADSRWPDEITPLIEQFGLGERVLRLGHVEEADLPALYSLADIFAFPSIIEGFGLPPLEAMACGTAVVVSNSSSLPEVVGDAGILVPPRDVDGLADALLKLLTSPSDRIKFENKALARASQFTWERTAHLTMDVYERVLSQASLSKKEAIKD